MTKRIFRSVFLTAFAVMLACIALIVGALYSYFSARQEAQLATEARLAAAGGAGRPRAELLARGRRASPPRASRPTAWTISKPWAAATACASPG